MGGLALGMLGFCGTGDDCFCKIEMRGVAVFMLYLCGASDENQGADRDEAVSHR